MRSVILGLAVSLDGMIEGPGGEYDWCPPPDGKEMKAFMDRIDAVFVGRKSFEVAGGSAFPGTTCYLFSNSLTTPPTKDVRLVRGDIVSQVKQIKAEKGKDIWLFGGASLTTSFLNESLIDEIWMAIVPVVLGAGKPLFQNIRQRKHFEIIKSEEKKGYLSVGLRYVGPASQKPSKKKKS
jgi:dihydrofolate reductase